MAIALIWSSGVHSTLSHQKNVFKFFVSCIFLLTGSSNQFRNYKSVFFTNFAKPILIVFDRKKAITKIEKKTCKTCSKGQIKSKWFFQADVSSKKERINSTLLLWNLRSTCFCSFFGKNWRNQKNISKLPDL